LANHPSAERPPPQPASRGDKQRKGGKKFLPENTPKARGELLSWLMSVASGVGPYAGQFVHFRTYAPEKLPYAINRYAFEAQRHFRILNERLAKRTRNVDGGTAVMVDFRAPTRGSKWC
jgi:glutathione S-transferase